MYLTTNTHVKAQIAALLHTQAPEIRLQFMNVHMQSGSYDCGLFALAFVTALAFGEPPGHYHFEQGKMRQHLYKCFERRKMEMFPYSKLRRATESSIKLAEGVPIYCECRMPELPDTKWIECCACKNWYHTDTCIHVSPAAFRSNAHWLCNNCK